MRDVTFVHSEICINVFEKIIPGDILCALLLQAVSLAMAIVGQAAGLLLQLHFPDLQHLSKTSFRPPPYL